MGMYDKRTAESLYKRGQMPEDFYRMYYFSADENFEYYREKQLNASLKRREDARTAEEIERQV